MSESSGAISIQFDVESGSLGAEEIEDVVRLVASEHGRTIDSISVVLTSHETVCELNARYLKSAEVTDVLAFDLGEGTPLESALDGEVYIDVETAVERHREFDSTVEAEIKRYLIHGLLHLIGFRDDTPVGKSEMHRLENHFLKISSESRR